MESFTTSVTGALSSQLSLATLAPIITAMLGICLSLIVGWFGFRFIYGKVKSAFKRGK